VPDEPQPVPPIFAPEVAARAVVWASHHPNRREIWVGAPTALTIIGNRLAPWVAERHLARTGFESQQTGTPVSPQRRDYLEAPLDDDTDHGGPGPFTDQAHFRSPQTWAATHRPVLAAAGAGLLGAATAATAALLRR
jgi:hypothetical protein